MREEYQTAKERQQEGLETLAASQGLGKVKQAMKAHDHVEALRGLRVVLNQAKKGSAEYREAFRLEAQEEISARRDYAREWENDVLSQGLDMTIRAVGAKADTLKIEYALMSPPLVSQFTSDESRINLLKQMGFTKLLLTNGLELAEQSWVVNLSGK